MFGAVFVAVSMGAGLGADVAPVARFDPRRDDRPIATVRGEPINGRYFVSRPLIGPVAGPHIPSTGSPGAEFYGAVDNIDAQVPVRVGHLVVSISPWERIDQPGLARFERARGFWLHENNYTGGVRTFINDRHLWEPPQAASEHVEIETIKGLPQPRATIKLQEEMPRERRPLRVEGGESGRISWPMNAPVRVVERASAGGVYAVAGRK